MAAMMLSVEKNLGEILYFAFMSTSLLIYLKTLDKLVFINGKAGTLPGLLHLF